MKGSSSNSNLSRPTRASTEPAFDGSSFAASGILARRRQTGTGTKPLGMERVVRQWSTLSELGLMEIRSIYGPPTSGPPPHDAHPHAWPEPMSDERSRPRPVPPDWDLSALSGEEVREAYLRFMDIDPNGGVIRLFGHRYGFLRPEVLVNIQKQLEQTVGASTKGFLYLAGERSAEAGLGLSGELLEGLDATRLTKEAFRRLADALAIIGYGRFELVASDLGSGENALTP